MALVSLIVCTFLSAWCIRLIKNIRCPLSRFPYLDENLAYLLIALFHYYRIFCAFPFHRIFNPQVLCSINQIAPVLPCINRPLPDETKENYKKNYFFSSISSFL